MENNLILILMIFCRFSPNMRGVLRIFPVFLIVFVVFGCSEKYQSYRKNYTFRSQTGVPDYANLDYWAAHPWKKDPSDSVPKPLWQEKRDSVADVFFVHPTTLTRKKDFDRANASIDDDYINAKTDYSTILLQASAFNQRSRVFAPRYRQAHIGNFYGADSSAASKALALAYEDVKASFQYYLKHFNKGRPIIIASHSQGAVLSARLLKEFFDGQPLQSQLVVAYIIGWPLEKKLLSNIPACSNPEQTGCVCSWRTFKEGYTAPWVKKEMEKGTEILVTNPLSWTTDTLFVSRSQNKGAILMNFNKIAPTPADAQIGQGILYTRKPKFKGSFLYRTPNYHIGDINLYYLNIRENLQLRLNSFR
jgi:hypothetical protein